MEQLALELPSSALSNTALAISNRKKGKKRKEVRNKKEEGIFSTEKIQNKRKSTDDFLNKELTILLRFKKRKTNPKLPTKKSEMLHLYHKWYNQTLPSFCLSPSSSHIVSKAEEMNASNGDNEDEEEIVVQV